MSVNIRRPKGRSIFIKVACAPCGNKCSDDYLVNLHVINLIDPKEG